MVICGTGRKLLPALFLWAAVTGTPSLAQQEGNGTVVIKKITIPSGGAGFGFTENISEVDNHQSGVVPQNGSNSFTLNDGQMSTFNNVSAGTYTVSENVLAQGFVLSTIVCSDSEEGGTPSTTDLASGAATIHLDANETVTCTFTNSLAQQSGDGTVVIKKFTIPSDGAGFGFTENISGVNPQSAVVPQNGSNSFTLNDGQMRTFNNVAAGTYTVSEDVLVQGFVLSTIACGDSAESGTPSTADLATRTATIHLDANETVICTFTNAKADTSVTILKSTNGQDASLPPGPILSLGDPVNWTYLVTNVGTETLTEVKVTDDRGVTVSCPKTTLAANESMTCTASGIAALGQYRNIGLVTAKTSDNRTATALNASHYLVQAAQAAVEIEKLTNGREADQAPGPSLPLGSPVIWSYVVTNTGNVPLTNVSVSDSRGVAVSCPKTTLALGETMICTAAGTVSPGQYSNTGTVNASPPTGSNATASDPSHYFGQGDENAGLHLEKLTNNEDADLPPGPTISVGSFVRWIYRVTNNGQVVLTDIVVSDDRGVFISCPKTSLGPGESMDCTASGTSIEGQYRNLGTVKARSPSNRVIEDSDPSHYLGQVAQPAIDIQKSTNGEDADSAPGPVIPLGAPVTWTYVVTNSGNVTLNNVVVTDNKGIAVSCPQSTLAVGESMTCVASAFGVAGQYSNVGTATGSPTTGANVTDSDPSYYFGGVAGAIHIEKLTSGQDADSPPGPTIGVGDPVVWTHKVTNTGGRKLTDISVSDNKGVAVTCPAPTLDFRPVNDLYRCSHGRGGSVRQHRDRYRENIRQCHSSGQRPESLPGRWSYGIRGGRSA